MEKENANMPTKFTDIISKSVLIHPGTPAVYQLNAKQEICGTVKRKTIGEKDVNKINKTILLVGEIGAGKSTLIHALLNYMMGVKFEDNVWFEIVTDEEEKCRWESKTSDVIVYEVFGSQDQTLPYSLTLIDTPGYGDTSKPEQDVISQSLLNWFDLNNGVNELHAVGLVMKASDNRLSDRLMYVFNSVVSLFGDNMEKNIVVLITHSDGRKPKNVFQALAAAKIKCARNEKSEPVHFLLNNCQHEDRTEERDYLEHANNITVEGLRQFDKYLDKIVPQTVKITVNVLDEHKCLKDCVKTLQDRIREIELKQREIKQIEEALNKHEEEMKMKKTRTEADEDYKEKVSGAMKCCCWKGQKPLHDVKEKNEQSKTESKERLTNLEKEMNKLTKEKSSLLEESYQHIVRLEQIALNVDSLSTHVHLDFLIENMKETGDTEKVQKLEEIRSRQDKGIRVAQRYLSCGNKSS